MKTVLKAGDFFRVRFMGEWRYGRVAENRRTYVTAEPGDIPDAAIVYRCKWKGSELIPLRQDVAKEIKSES